MKTLTISTLILAGLALAGSAEAKKAAKRHAIVCESYSIIDNPDPAKDYPVAVCYDKHTAGGLVLRYWTEMVLPGPEGLKNVVVGYR